jgi:dTDP-4-dehydrorhamnose 3,5-epimerase-like enzyme
MPRFPEHRIQPLAIEGVYLVDLEIHVDSRGLLYEVIHASDCFVDQIRQVYHVCNPRADTIRAFHAHDRLRDWFHIVYGSALFCLVDGRESSRTYRSTARLVLSYRKPQLLVVPSGVYHGWMSLEPETIMTSVASEEYNRTQPDEHRVAPDHFDDLFGGNPWKTDAR